MSDHGDHTTPLGSTRLGKGFSRQLQEHLLARMLDESRRMFAEYFAVDRAHTVMLAEQGIVTADQARQILLELNRIEALGPDGLSMDPAFDSFLPQIERAMTARIGEAVAGRMHTGRSRIAPTGPEEVAPEVALAASRPECHLLPVSARRGLSTVMTLIVSVEIPDDCRRGRKSVRRKS